MGSHIKAFPPRKKFKGKWQRKNITAVNHCLFTCAAVFVYINKCILNSFKFFMICFPHLLTIIYLGAFVIK